MSAAGAAELAIQRFDYKAALTSGGSSKGIVNIARDGLTYGSGEAVIRGLPAGQYNIVLDVDAYDYGNGQPSSLKVDLCTINVKRSNATAGCRNSSLELPYGDGLTGSAEIQTS